MNPRLTRQVGKSFSYANAANENEGAIVHGRRWRRLSPRELAFSNETLDMLLRFLAPVMAALLAYSSVSAKRVEERYGLFSVEIPDVWKFEPPDYTGAGGGYYNADRSVSIGLKSYDIDKMTLNEWARLYYSRLAEIGPTPKCVDDRLNRVRAKRVDWGIINDGVVSWLAARRDQGASISLSYPRGTRENIKAIRTMLTSSFRWK